MSDEEEAEMGSTLVGPTIEDVNEVPQSSVCIDIDGGDSSTSTDATAVTAADLAALEERMATLLHVHSDVAACRGRCTCGCRGSCTRRR